MPGIPKPACRAQLQRLLLTARIQQPHLPPKTHTMTQGIYQGGVCTYAAEYRHYVPDWQVVQHVHRLCSNLVAGSWHPPHKNVPKATCAA